MWDHFFPSLFPKDSEALKFLDILLWEMGAKRCLNGTSKVNKHTDMWTNRLIESISPEDRCFEQIKKIKLTLIMFIVPPLQLRYMGEGSHRRRRGEGVTKWFTLQWGMYSANGTLGIGDTTHSWLSFIKKINPLTGDTESLNRRW